MMRRGAILQLLLSAVIIWGCMATFAAMAAAQATEAKSDDSVVILDTRGFWRIFQTMAPPLVDGNNGLEPLLRKVPYLDQATPLPQGDWAAVDYDDSRWARMPALRAMRTPYLSRLYLRGRFAVDNPAQVKDLTLSVDFYGGAIVYVNGKEVAREGLPAGKSPELAQSYPLEAFTSDGKLVTGESFSRGLKEPERQRLREARTRRIHKVAVPKDLLRKGVNVVAVEIVRAPYDGVVLSQKRFDLCWGTCEIRRIQLTAGKALGIQPNAVRPKGLQVWNSDPLMADFDADWGDPNEPLRPLELVAARNGIFSGKVVVGSTEAIEGLKATVSALKGPGGATIPASALQVRYALPWEEEGTRINYYDDLSAYPRGAGLLSALDERAPERVEVVAHEPNRYISPLENEPEPVGGAVVPVWLTAKVPAEVKAGEYAGSMKIEVRGSKAIEVPVKVRVSVFKLPDPADYATWVEMIQVPDTLAQEYDVPLWSEKHWAMIERSMKLIAQTGSRVVYIPLLAETNSGNSESMVRWVRKSDGSYDYDFSIMEKYLDLAIRTMGKPKLVIFDVWELYIVEKDDYADSKGQTARAIKYLESRDALQGGGPRVTVVGGDGKTESVELPRYSNEASVGLWKAVMAGVRKRLADRGLSEAGVLGTISDVVPHKKHVELFHKVAPGMSWICHSHHGWSGGKLYGMENVVYQSRVWNISHYFGGEKEKPLYGWNRSNLLVDYERHRNINRFPATAWRHFAEMNITGGQKGIGRIGADNWFAMRNPRGERSGTVASRYPQSSRRNLDLYSSTLAPGAEGAVATQRFEAFREGVQESEARIAIERALIDDDLRGKLGDELADRCRQVLHERLLEMWRAMNNLQLTGPGWYALNWRGDVGVAGSAYFQSSDYQSRTAKLFDLAAEVEAKLGR